MNKFYWLCLLILIILYLNLNKSNIFTGGNEENTDNEKTKNYSIYIIIAVACFICGVIAFRAYFNNSNKTYTRPTVDMPQESDLNEAYLKLITSIKIDLYIFIYNEKKNIYMVI